MTDLEITIKLPEELVRRANESNLLADDNIAEILQAELDRRADRLKHGRAFLEIAARVSAAEPLLTQEEIDLEIEAVRQEKRI